MDDDLNQASASGFVLGLLVADEIHRATCESPAAQEAALFELVLGIAGGTRTLVPDDPQLMQLLTPRPDTNAAHESLKTAALRLVESYRKTLLS